MELLTCFFFFWRRAEQAAGPAFLFPAVCGAGRRAFDFDFVRCFFFGCKILYPKKNDRMLWLFCIAWGFRRASSPGNCPGALKIARGKPVQAQTDIDARSFETSKKLVGGRRGGAVVGHIRYLCEGPTGHKVMSYNCNYRTLWTVRQARPSTGPHRWPPGPSS